MIPQQWTSPSLSSRFVRISLIGALLLAAPFAFMIVDIAPRLLFSRQGILLVLGVGLVFLRTIGPVVLLQLLALSLWFSVVAAPLPVIGRFMVWAPLQEYLFYFLVAMVVVQGRSALAEPARKRGLMIVGLLILPVALFGALGMVHDLDPAFGPAYWRWTSLYPLAILIAILAFVRTSGEAWRLARTLVMGSGAFAGLSVWMWATERIISTASTLGGARLGGMAYTPGVSFYWDPVSLGSTLAICLPFSLGLFLGSDKALDRVMSGIACCIITGAIVASGIRAAWIGAPLGILVVLALRAAARPRALLWGIVLLPLVAIVAQVMVDSLSGNDVIMTRIASLANVSSDPNLVIRQGYWQFHWNDIVNNPIIPMGYYYLGGLGNPHNMYIFLAMGTGMFGLACFASLLGYLGLHFWRGSRGEDLRVSSLASAGAGALVTLLVVGISDSSFMDSWTTGVIFMLLGVGFAASLLESQPRLDLPVSAGFGGRNMVSNEPRQG
jgi:hypothetical protein